TLPEFADDQLTDRAAALTYYAVLAIFPGLLVVVSLLGLLGKSNTQPLVTNLTQAVPSDFQTIIAPAVNKLRGQHGAAGVAAIAGLVIALWSASGYISAFMRAANVIYDVPEGRPFWKTTPVRVGVTLLIMVLLVASAFMVIVSGGLARHLGLVLGIRCALATLLDRRYRLEHRQMARPADHRQRDHLDLVLGRAQRQTGIPVGQPGRAHRSDRVADRLRSVRSLRREFRQLQPHLRQHRGRDHLPGVAVDLQP